MSSNQLKQVSGNLSQNEAKPCTVSKPTDVRSEGVDSKIVKTDVKSEEQKENVVKTAKITSV